MHVIGNIAQGPIEGIVEKMGLNRFWTTTILNIKACNI